MKGLFFSKQAFSTNPITLPYPTRWNRFKAFLRRLGHWLYPRDVEPGEKIAERFTDTLRED